LGQGVGEGEELGRRLADRQHAEGARVRLRNVEPAAALGEGVATQLELLLGHGGADQGLQAHDRLGWMQRRGEGEVEAVAFQAWVRLAYADHGQEARRAGGFEPAGQGQGLVAQAGEVDDGGLDV
jgi:hypothetical protein